MSDDIHDPVEGVDADATGGGKGATDLHGEIKDFLAGAGAKVRERVKDHLVEKELGKRVELVLKGLDKRKEMQDNIRKIKPDQVAVVDDGTKDGKKSETFSPTKFKELNEAKDKLKKMDEALEKALGDKADYEPLKKQVG